MSATRIAGALHKWLALLMAVQILFWFASGLFFAAVPIERVRSEHSVAPPARSAIPFDAAVDGLRRIAGAGAAAGETIEVRTVLGRPMARVSHGADRPRLYDLATGNQVSPISRSFAIAVAEADQAGPARAKAAAMVTAPSTDYRGALPAWRVDFEDGTRRSVYIAADTAAVTARRSTLWRVYDFLWALHIMDFEEHEDFNTPLLVAVTGFGLILVVTGIVLLPARLGFTAWRRRRRRR